MTNRVEKCLLEVSSIKNDLVYISRDQKENPDFLQLWSSLEVGRDGKSSFGTNREELLSVGLPVGFGGDLADELRGRCKSPISLP